MLAGVLALSIMVTTPHACWRMPSSDTICWSPGARFISQPPLSTGPLVETDQRLRVLCDRATAFAIEFQQIQHRLLKDGAPS